MGQEQYSVSYFMLYLMLSSYILLIIYTFFSSFKIDFARNPDFTSLTKRVYTANISNPLMLGQIPILTNCQSVYGGQREKRHLEERQRMLKLNLHSSLRFSGMALLVLEGTPVWKLWGWGESLRIPVQELRAGRSHIVHWCAFSQYSILDGRGQEPWVLREGDVTLLKVIQESVIKEL